MPLFATEDEWPRLAADAAAVADKADGYIRDIHVQLETVKAAADASAITAEQTCSLIEQKYISLSADFAALQKENVSLSAAVEQRAAEVAELRAEKSRFAAAEVEKDGAMEKLLVDKAELEKSRRQLLHIIEQRDTEIAEKNALIKSYHDKIVDLTDEVARREAKACDFEAELARARAANARLLQEKELIEKHNSWLNDELTSKLDNVAELRRTYSEYEIEMSAKLAENERQLNDHLRSLNVHKEREKQLELKLASLREEVSVFKEEATVKEERLSTELAIVSRLAELYKGSTEEWSRKAGDLEGAIKALEEHLNQLERDYKEKLANSIAEKEDLQKEIADLNANLKLSEAANNKSVKENERKLLTFSTFDSEDSIAEMNFGKIEEDSRMLVPSVPSGVSATALAASLLRDGWSLAKMYEKYQEIADALRHERAGRKHSEAVLERVLLEVEEKAGLILEERAEHERMVEAYNLMDQRLLQSLSEHSKLEDNVRMLKAELRRKERDYDIADKEITDLQKQNTILVKECQDIQMRYGGGLHYIEGRSEVHFPRTLEEPIEDFISEHLLSFKDVNDLIKQNSHLRSLVRILSAEKEQEDRELRDQFEIKLQNLKDEAAKKFEDLRKKSEEQEHIIEALNRSISMYKKLYEEGHQGSSSNLQPDANLSGYGRKDLKLLIESSSEASKKANEAAVEQVRSLEEQLAKSRDEALSFRLERDRFSVEAKYANERCEDLKKEVEQRKEKWYSIEERNAQFCQLIIDHQKKLHEMSELLRASDESSHKLSMEVSRLMQEKDILVKAEERALDEVRNLSERVHRLQTSLNTIHSAEASRENSRAIDNRQKEEYVKQIERGWAEAKKELQEERDRFRHILLEKENILEVALKNVEQFAKEKEDTLLSAHAAEARASAAEARCLDLEGKISLSLTKIGSEQGIAESSSDASNSVIRELQNTRIEVESLKQEADSSKYDMLQYKQIAMASEAALKEIGSAYDQFRSEADQIKNSQESEIFVLKEQLSELEKVIITKSEELSQAALDKQQSLSRTLGEIASLKEENAEKVSQLAEQEVCISLLREDLDKATQRWQTSQKNYERQVILQSETIQELTKTSQELSGFRDEVMELRKVVDIQKAEHDNLKSMWLSEKAILEKSKDEAQKARREIDEQNKILHSRLEALHIKLAEKERGCNLILSENSSKDSQEDSDLQIVINYLRKSKEIAETEMSLLKQEKLRLQSQLESSLKASKRAQDLLDSERSNTKFTLFSEGEFKSLKLQVNELNLLRESNMQLREESKHNFEECQNLREIVRKMKSEAESINTLLVEKEIEITACKKEIEIQDTERSNLENRNLELLAKTKNLDVQEYKRLKEDYSSLQIKLIEKENEVEDATKSLSSKQEIINKLELDISNSRSELMETERKCSSIQQSEATLRADLERIKKLQAMAKKRIEVAAKEKESLIKEKDGAVKKSEELSADNHSLLKQVEDLTTEKQILENRLSKRHVVDASSDLVLKEKDAKIQVLQKHIEKEKSKSQKNESALIQEKDKHLNERQNFKHALKNLVETGALSASYLTSEKLDESTRGCLQSLDGMEPLLPCDNSSLPPSTSTETSSLDASAALPVVSGPPVGGDRSGVEALVPIVGLLQKPLEDRAKRSVVTKTAVELRKTGGRRLVRPRLEDSPEPAGDTESTEMDGVSNQFEEKKLSSITDPVSLSAPASLKRELSPGPEIEGVSIQIDDISDGEQPPAKKIKTNETIVQGAEIEEESVPISDMIESDIVAGDAIQLSTGLVLAGQEESNILSDPIELKEQHTETDPTPNETPPEDEVLSREAEAPDSSDILATEVDVANSMEVDSDREEGEFLLDSIEQQGADTSVIMAHKESIESQGEPGPDVDTLGTGSFFLEEKLEGEEMINEIVEASDKPKIEDGDRGDGAIMESAESAQQIVDPSAETSAVKDPDLSSSKDKEEEKKEVPASTIVNIQERARENSARRRAGGGVLPAARGRGRISVSPRGRGRMRGRIVRPREGDKEHQ